MTRSVQAECTFSVPSRVLYSAFLDSRDLSKMTLSACNIKPEVGGEFSLFSGGVLGRVKELVPNTKIVEDWKFSQWGDEYSTLELSFIAVNDHATKLQVNQTEIPETDAHGNSRQDELVLSGWTDKFFIGLEKVLGFPVLRD